MSPKKKTFVKIISGLFVSLVLSLAGCASKLVNVPDTRIHIEIPFIDGPEAAYINVVSKKEGLIGPEEWAELRPYMIMIHIKDWSGIKVAWYEACRYAGNECNLIVDSIDQAIIWSDKLIKHTVEGRK